MSSFASWHARAKAAHAKALAAPQAFALTGDGQHTLAIWDSPERCPELLGPRLVEARYRDWQANGGLFPDQRQSAAAAPQLVLTGEETPVPKANGTKHPETDLRAIMILRSLVDEFGALFPEEFAAAIRYLEETA